MSKLKKDLLIDANVLIDFRNSDFSLFGLVNSNIGRVYIINRILDEVKGVEIDECVSLGLTIINPEREIIIEAESKLAQLSSNDHLCYLTAEKSGYICVTNDKNLRKICEENGVKVLWGLELIQFLVEKEVLGAEEATQVVKKIQQKSPRYFPNSLVQSFEKIVRRIESSNLT